MIDDETDALAEFERNRQKTRGRTAPPRRFDQSQLRATTYQYQVHRDYGAHFFRWAWVSRRVDPDESILDVGCGQDQPLCKAIWGHPRLHKGGHGVRYVGVDLNPIRKKVGFAWATILDEYDFLARYKELGTFDHVACLEVVEHMAVEDGRRLLRALRACLRPKNGRLYLSTPIFSGVAAANHVHEYGLDELRTEIEAAGLKVEERFGTFGQLPRLRKRFTAAERALHDRLATYYGNDALSLIFAPLYPDDASNNLWVLSS